MCEWRDKYFIWNGEKQPYCLACEDECIEWTHLRLDIEEKEDLAC